MAVFLPAEDQAASDAADQSALDALAALLGDARNEDTGPTSATEAFSVGETSPFDWAFNLGDQLARDLVSAGDELGYPRYTMLQFWGANMGSIIDQIENSFFPQADRDLNEAMRFQQLGLQAGVDPSHFQNAYFMGSDYYKSTAPGFQELVERARSIFGQMFPGIGDALGRSSGGGRGGGGGGLSAQDIRNRFDVDQLAGQINDMSRVLLLKEYDNPRQLARDYVEQIVATGGKKNIDFQTFVRTKLKDDPRWASLYALKPESMSEEQFMAPYLQLAQQSASPGRAADLAAGGAMFAASPEAFAARLRREQTTSAPFMNDLQARLSRLRGVLRG